MNNVRIVLMERHFLYLPMLLAAKKNFYSAIPAGYRVALDVTANSTDDDAINMLMDRSARNSDVWFAVCDPAAALKFAEADPKPAVLAALVTNTAFWAVNHDANPARNVAGLNAFDRLVCFAKGTTSFAIANAILKMAPGNKPSLYVVKPKQELVTLVDRGDKTLVLSPDILGIEALTRDSHKGIRVQLALGRTAEFSNMLVTALVGLDDIVRLHPNLVSGLLSAIYCALLETKTRSNDAFECVSAAFGQFIPTISVDPAQETAEKRECIETALKIAEDAGVFPATITIARPQWSRAVEMAFRSSNTRFDEADIDGTFKTLVEPYRHLADNVIRSTLQPLFVKSQMQPVVTLGQQLGWLVTASLVAVLVHALTNWSGALLAVVCFAFGFYSAASIELQRHRPAYVAHWILLIVFGGTGIGALKHLTSPAGLAEDSALIYLGLLISVGGLWAGLFFWYVPRMPRE